MKSAFTKAMASDSDKGKHSSYGELPSKNGTGYFPLVFYSYELSGNSLVNIDEYTIGG